MKLHTLLLTLPMLLPLQAAEPAPMPATTVQAGGKANNGPTVVQAAFRVALYHVRTEATPVEGAPVDKWGGRLMRVRRTYCGVVDTSTGSPRPGTPVEYTEETQEHMSSSAAKQSALPQDVREYPLFILTGSTKLRVDATTGTLSLNGAQRINAQQEYIYTYENGTHKALTYEEGLEKTGLPMSKPCPQALRSPAHGEGAELQSFYNKCDAVREALHRPEVWQELLRDSANHELMLFFAAKEHKRECILQLLELGCPAECAPYFYTTPLSYVCGELKGGESSETDICRVQAYEGQTELISLLLERGAKPNTPSGVARLTPLMYAVRSGHAESVRLLLAAGAQPDARDANGMNALHWAVAEKQTHLLPLLLATPQAQSMVNAALVTCNSISEKCRATLRTGMTPLHTAAELADAESVRLLLQAGANPHTVDRFGRKAIELLPEQASQELRHTLEAAMARPACAAKP